MLARECIVGLNAVLFIAPDANTSDEGERNGELGDNDCGDVRVKAGDCPCSVVGDSDSFDDNLEDNPAAMLCRKLLNEEEFRSPLATERVGLNCVSKRRIYIL